MQPLFSWKQNLGNNLMDHPVDVFVCASQFQTNLAMEMENFLLLQPNPQYLVEDVIKAHAIPNKTWVGWGLVGFSKALPTFLLWIILEVHSK